jgi:cytochrome b involved in lipid metabolism
MTIKTFFAICALIFTSIVAAVFISGYISKNNRVAREQYETTLQEQVDKMTVAMDAANAEIEQLKKDKESAVALPVVATTSPTTTTPAKTTTTTTTKTTLSTSVVAKHAVESNCWITVSSKVYDVTSYISMHPGGKATIITQCGKESTTAFTTKGYGSKHSPAAWTLLGTYLVGKIGASI